MHHSVFGYHMHHSQSFFWEYSATVFKSGGASTAKLHRQPSALGLEPRRWSRRLAPERRLLFFDVVLRLGLGLKWYSYLYQPADNLSAPYSTDTTNGG